MCEFKKKFKNPLTFWRVAEGYLCETLSSDMKTWFGQHIQECEVCAAKMKFNCMLESVPDGVWEAAMTGMAERRSETDRRSREPGSSNNKPVQASGKPRPVATNTCNKRVAKH